MKLVGRPARTVALALAVAAAPAWSARAASIVGVVTPAWVAQRIRIAGRGFPDPMIGALGFQASKDADASRRSKALTGLAETGRFDPVSRLSNALVQELESAGHPTRKLSVQRRSIGGSSSLRRGDIPEKSDVKFWLDVNIHTVFVAETNNGSFRPGASVTFVWLDSAGRPISLPRSLLFNEDIRQWGKPALGIWLGTTSRRPEDVAPAEGCEFKDIDELTNASLKLWGCFDDGFAKLAMLIAASAPN